MLASLFKHCDNEYRTGVEDMLKNGPILNIYWPFSKQVALPLCKLHLAVVERLEYSNDPEGYAGGDFNLYPWQV